MTPADDLKPGMWVAVVGQREPEEDEQPDYRMWSFTTTVQTTPKVRFDGKPFQILAVSLPFICVIGSGGPFAIDMRERQVQRLSKQYVRAMLTKPPEKKPDENLSQPAGPFVLPQWITK